MSRYSLPSLALAARWEFCTGSSFVASTLCAGLPEMVPLLLLTSSCIPSYHIEIQRDRMTSGLNFELTFAPALRG